MTSGIYSVQDLLQVTQASAAEFGINRVAETIAADTAALNEAVNQMMADLADPVYVQSQVWGSAAAHAMTEVDEYGVAIPDNQTPGITASAPLRRFAQKLGWTQSYFEIATPAELATQYLAKRKGYLLELQRQLKKQIFRNTSYTYVDRLYNNVSLTVFPLINADSSTLPDSPMGVSFDGSTHTHYLDETSFLPGYIDSLVSTVTEHGNTRGVKIFCALADAPKFTSASAGFTALPDEATQTLLTKLVSGEASSFEDYENRLIGYWSGGIPVWVKPFMIANYVMCVATQMPEKALMYRQRPQASLQGWRVDAPYKEFPLVAENAVAEFGFGGWNRTMAAILYFGGASFVIPTIP